MKRCAVCGYDLQGLDRRGVCPECGNELAAQTVEITLGEMPRVIAMLRARLPHARRAVIIAPACVAAAIVIEAWWLARELTTSDTVTDLSPLAAAVMLVSGFYCAWAWLGVSPRSLGGAATSQLRLRWVAPAWPMVAGGAVLAAAATQAMAEPGSMRWTPMLLVAASVVIAVATHTLGVLQVRWLARRAGSRRIAARLGRAAYGPPMTVAGWIAAMAISPVTILIDPITGLVPVLWVASTTTLVPVLMLVWLMEARAGTSDLIRAMSAAATAHGSNGIERG